MRPSKCFSGRSYKKVIQPNFNENESQESETLTLSVKMNDAEFKANMKKAKVHCRQVLAAVNAFSPNDITSVLDRDELHANLQRIRLWSWKKTRPSEMD